MDPAGAMKQLQNKLKINANANADNLIELARALDYLPLAITQAAATIRQDAPIMSIDAYVSRIQGHGEAQQVNTLQRHVATEDADASRSIILSWFISFHRIRDRSGTAAALLARLSFLDGQKLPSRLAQAVYSCTGAAYCEW